jgi:hypothetical protein
MISILSNFAHKSEMRESQDEMLVGEIVRAMARQGAVTTQFMANNDFQRVRFRMLGDPTLANVYITLNRITGSSALGSMVFGSKATLAITAEIKNYISDPDDLIAMFQTDLANLFKMPVLGGIRLNHELNSVLAHTSTVIEIGDYVVKGEKGAQALEALLDSHIDKLRDRLVKFKRPDVG